MKEYFEVNNVIYSTMEIYSDLLGLKFEKVEMQTWDEDVLEYQVRDSKSDEILGHIYLDLYHRPHKNTYPRVIGALYRSKIKDKINLPAAAMIQGYHKEEPTLLQHK